MNTTGRWAVLAAMATLAAVAPPPGRADPLQDCADSAADPADYSACLARRQRQAMRRLEEAREALVELARGRGEPALEALDRAEEAFDRFVEAGCLGRVRMGSDEASALDLRRDCVIRLLEWRADELEAVAEELSAESDPGR